jgi:hypothetical protein
MKQRAKIYFCGILAFILVLGACPTDTAPDRSKLNLSGQVYIQEIDLEKFPPAFDSSEYKNSLSISDGGLGGTGQITEGKLSYSIGIPEQLQPISEGLDYLKSMYSSLEFSSDDVNAAVVALEVTNSEEYGGLLKGLVDLKLDRNLTKPPPIITLTIETVNYVYVDNNLNITADKKTFDNNDLGFLDLDFPISMTTEKINLGLKKGWNSLYSKITVQVKIPMELLPLLPSLINSPNPDLSGLDLSALEPTGNLKMSVGDPADLKWTLVPSQF